MNIAKEKIREVIGSGGKVIREICEVSGAKVDIEDDGTIRIAATSEESGKKAYDMIYSIVAEPEIGQIYTGKVVRIVDFGAFVNFMGPKDGLIHISELADHRVAKVDDVVKEGDTVKVKVLEMDNRGKIRLSMRMVDQQTGEDISDRVGKRKEKEAASN
jgi:polyribonucleotide nucleotidyltransferase